MQKTLAECFVANPPSGSYTMIRINDLRLAVALYNAVTDDGSVDAINCAAANMEDEK